MLAWRKPRHTLAPSNVQRKVARCNARLTLGWRMPRHTVAQCKAQRTLQERCGASPLPPVATDVPLDLLALSAAFLAGLLGGVHCVAMCGGIAVGAAAAMRTQGHAPALRAALVLNLGRVCGYAVGGALAGGLGAMVVVATGTEWVGIALRSAVGAVLVLAALRLLDRSGRLGFLGRSGAAVWKRLSPLTRRLLPATTLPRQ